MLPYIILHVIFFCFCFLLLFSGILEGRGFFCSLVIGSLALNVSLLSVSLSLSAQRTGVVVVYYTRCSKLSTPTAAAAAAAAALKD